MKDQISQPQKTTKLFDIYVLLNEILLNYVSLWWAGRVQSLKRMFMD